MCKALLLFVSSAILLATNVHAVDVSLPCCAKFYEKSGTCAASNCPNKFATKELCVTDCGTKNLTSSAKEDCERACDGFICRQSLGIDNKAQEGKIDCITFGGVEEGGLYCGGNWTEIKATDNGGKGCPGYLGKLTGKAVCYRSGTVQDEATCVAAGCCKWENGKCKSTTGEVKDSTTGDEISKLCPGAKLSWASVPVTTTGAPSITPTPAPSPASRLAASVFGCSVMTLLSVCTINTGLYLK